MIGYKIEETTLKENKKKNYTLHIGMIVIMLLGFSTVLLPKETFLSLTREDGPFEWAGAFLFLVTCILFFVLFFRKDKFQKVEDQQYFNSYSKRIFFLLLGLLFFVLVGEEISWGQRIFGFATPEGMEEKNIQGEFNLHNMDFLHLKGEDRVRKTGIKAWFTAKKIFVYVFLLYLFFLPLAVKFIEPIRNLAKRLYVPVPIIDLGILFILDILLFKAFKPLTDGTTSMLRGLAEVEEFNFALILLLIPLLWIGFPSKKISL